MFAVKCNGKSYSVFPKSAEAEISFMASDAVEGGVDVYIFGDIPFYYNVYWM